MITRHGAGEAQLGPRDANTVDHLSVAFDFIHRREHEITAQMCVDVLLLVDRYAIGSDESDLVVKQAIQRCDVVGEQRVLEGGFCRIKIGKVRGHYATIQRLVCEQRVLARPTTGVPQTMPFRDGRRWLRPRTFGG